MPRANVSAPRSIPYMSEEPTLDELRALLRFDSAELAVVVVSEIASRSDDSWSLMGEAVEHAYALYRKTKDSGFAMRLLHPLLYLAESSFKRQRDARRMKRSDRLVRRDFKRVLRALDPNKVYEIVLADLCQRTDRRSHRFDPNPEDFVQLSLLASLLKLDGLEDKHRKKTITWLHGCNEAVSGDSGAWIFQMLEFCNDTSAQTLDFCGRVLERAYAPRETDPLLPILRRGGINAATKRILDGLERSAATFDERASRNSSASSYSPRELRAAAGRLRKTATQLRKLAAK